MIPDLLERNAYKFPDRKFFKYKDSTYTYSELNNSSTSAVKYIGSGVPVCTNSSMSSSKTFPYSCHTWSSFGYVNASRKDGGGRCE